MDRHYAVRQGPSPWGARETGRRKPIVGETSEWPISGSQAPFTIFAVDICSISVTLQKLGARDCMINSEHANLCVRPLSNLMAEITAERKLLVIKFIRSQAGHSV